MLIPIPNSAGFPEPGLWESNDCHSPGGRPDGGQFCSKGLSSGMIVVRSGEFDLHDVGKTRRFMYHPDTGHLLLGASGMVARNAAGSHAEEFADGKNRLSLPGNYDDYVKGWVAAVGTKEYKDGVVHFHAVNFERNNAEMADRYLKTLEFFIRNGAVANTRIVGLQLRANQPFQGKLGEMFPSMVPAGRKKGRRSRR